jgi:DNA-directed RNA polymerase specialized sigma24 family protein
MPDPHDILFSAIPELELLLADPRLADPRLEKEERNRARRDAASRFSTRAVEVVASACGAAGVTLDPAPGGVLSRARDFLQRQVGALWERMEGATPDEIRSEVERLLLILWRKCERASRGGALTPEEQKNFSSLTDAYHQRLVRCVAGWLRRSAKNHAGATASGVAQSVWQSLMAWHADEFSLSDPESAWAVMVELAERHCERWNKRGQRHPVASLDAPAGGRGGAEAEPLGAQLAATEPPTEDALLYRELRLCLENAGEAPAGASQPAEPAQEGGAAVEDGIGLCRRLTPRQRQVLMLKLLNKTATEIAEQLHITQAQVNYTWKTVKDEARSLAS